MFKRILIANRGEIAVRIIRACQEMGIETIAIYSLADKESLHVRLADKAVCIGDVKLEDTYLNSHVILSAAMLYNAEAIHPGYGFLSENDEFVRLCEKVNIKFIGPDSEAVKLMANKSLAVNFAESLGIPTIPGSKGVVSGVKEAAEAADKIGYPVLLKAGNGGGGKGIRKIYSHEEFENAFLTCSMEAENAFGSSELYLEKYIEKPRHIEIQILSDNYGNVIVLGERDCTLQRKNQKVIEEAPADILNDNTRKMLWSYSKMLAESCKYKNAGTVEFLMDAHNNVYFMEMNTRLQVEHPVSEMTTCIDIVKEQIRVAAGLPLRFTQKDILIRGHSMECRINAEIPNKNFCPSSGKIINLNFPGGNGVRIDTAVYAGATISANYDSNIAKAIVYGEDREECIKKMKVALNQFVVEGIETNIDFLLSLLNYKSIIFNCHHTQTIDELINSGYLQDVEGAAYDQLSECYC